MELTFNIKNYNEVLDAVLRNGGEAHWFITDDLVELGSEDDLEDKIIIDKILKELKERGIEFKIHH